MTERLEQAPEHAIVGNIIRLFSLPGRSGRIEEIKESIIGELQEISDPRTRTTVVDALLRLTAPEEQPPLHPGVQLSPEDKTILTEALESYVNVTLPKRE